jgi:DNA invertase Pin-like site-specific DNA recombinase
MGEPVPVCAGVYCRISRDDAGDMLGVRRQEKDARGLAARKGWEVVEVFVDDDVSAWTGRRRPSYERMLAAIESGSINAVVAYDLDRLHRLPRELERFFEVCDRAGVTRLASVAGDVDLASSDGQLIARIMGAVAKKSSDDTSRRIRRRMQDDAEAGKPHGPRAFGYNEDRLTVNKAEAKVVKEMVRHVLAGEPLNAIARDLNERGVPGPQGGRGWAGTTVRAVVSNPRLAGLRAHHGVIVGEGQWAAVIDRATHERIVAYFAGAGRRRTSPARLNLLSGLMFCGRCGGHLFYMRRRTANFRGTITCGKAPGRPNCGGLSVSAQSLDEFITEAVLNAVDDGGLALAMQERAGGSDDAAVAEVVALETRMAELGEMFAAGEISRGEWATVRKKIEGRLAEARKAITAVTKARQAPVKADGLLRDAWPKLSTSERRAVIEAVVDKITVSPATSLGCRFNPTRVTISWKA